MGYSQSWLAIKGQSSNAVLEPLGLKATGRYEEFPESPLVGALLPGGWYLIVSDCSGHRFMQESTIKSLPQAEIIVADVEEHAMVSSISGWKNGVGEWSVLHDSEQGMEHMDVQGHVPAIFGEIYQRLLKKQQDAGGVGADVDYLFDAPTELGKALTGYKHDEYIEGAGEAPFEVLEEVKSKRSLLGKLFRA